MADSHNALIKDIEERLNQIPPNERAAVIADLEKVLRKVAPSSNSIVTDHYREIQSKPLGSSARRLFKYATIAILAMFILFVASIFIIPLAIFKYIAVDNFEKDFTFSFTDHRPRMERFQGKLSAQPLTNFAVALSNGQIAVTTDQNSQDIVYECEIESDNTVQEAEAAKVENGNATITLLNVENADCEITVPARLPLSVNVTNGRIALSEVDQNVEANLTNGEIEFESNAAFEMTATAQVGSVDGLESFQSGQKNKKGPKSSAVLSVGNGRIVIED